MLQNHLKPRDEFRQENRVILVNPGTTGFTPPKAFLIVAPFVRLLDPFSLANAMAANTAGALKACPDQIFYPF